MRHETRDARMAIDPRGWFRPRLLDIASDLRPAARSLRRSPVFVAAAVLSIALGIGANAAAFSLADDLYLAPTDGVVGAPSLRRLYVREETQDRAPTVRTTLSWPELFALRAGARGGFGAITGYETPRQVHLDDRLDGPMVRQTAAVANYFTTLGVQPALGRLFTPDDERDDAPTIAAVLSWGLWQRQFGGTRSVLGKTIRLNGIRVIVVGVAARSFSGVDLDATDVWVPIGPIALAERGVGWQAIGSLQFVNVIVRLRSDVALPLAEEFARRALGAMPAALPPVNRRTLRPVLAPLRRARGPAISAAEVSLATRCAGAALLVLLAGAANLANLWLVRLLARRGELAVRVSLGAGRAQIVRPLVTEALLLCAMGGALALAVADAGGRVLRGALLPNVSWGAGPMDHRVVVVMIVTALAYVVIGAVLPGWRASAADPADALRTAANRRATAAGLRGTVLATQVALSVAALFGAITLARSALRARAYDVGFDADHALFVSMWFRPEPSGTQWRGIIAQVTDRIRRAPGVHGVGATIGLPYLSTEVDTLSRPGDAGKPMRTTAQPRGLAMSAEAMQALGIRPLRGRLLEQTDDRSASRVVVVSETLARTLWPGKDAIGQCLIIGAGATPCSRVVGITPDLVVTNLSDGRMPAYFVPLDERANSETSYFFLAHAADPRLTATYVRKSLGTWRDDLVGLAVQPLGDLVADDMRPTVVGTYALSILSALTLVLAVIGMYGVLAHTVEQRTKELAIRAALGATRTQLARSVLASLVRPLLTGTVVGLLVAWWIMRGASALLFHTSPYDAGSAVAASLLLLGAAAVAAAFPIRRAVRITPGAALVAE